jgi:hypothetical protein
MTKGPLVPAEAGTQYFFQELDSRWSSSPTAIGDGNERSVVPVSGDKR